ncbi:MAG: tetratricopeptide repeat protein [Victivallales bacterium]|nr:tetratricopeptide repeat protein [Victivallales bacterium]
MNKVLFLTAMIVSTNLFGADQNKKIAELEQRIGKLEKAVAALTAKPADADKVKTSAQSTVSARSFTKSPQTNVSAQVAKARERMRADSKIYSRPQLIEIEKLYQSRGYRNGSKEKTQNLKTLVSKYPRANRTGCAVLYLGQFSSTGKEQKNYLKQAIDKYADCFYGDGVQVGAYAKFYLASIYQRQGKKTEAEKLYQEILDKYPNAIDHRAYSLSSLIAYNLNSLE